MTEYSKAHAPGFIHGVSRMPVVVDAVIVDLV